MRDVKRSAHTNNTGLKANGGGGGDGFGRWQASSPQEAAQLVTDQVLRGDTTAAISADDGSETLVPTSTVLIVAGGVGALYGGYNYAVHRLGQDKVDRLVALVRSSSSANHPPV